MPPGVYWQTAKAGALYRDRDWLNRAYWVEMKNLNQIAEICGADNKTLWYWMKKFGIKTRNCSEAQIGQLGNNWKGGISEKTWKRVAYETYGRKCMVCGTTEGRIDVHHKDRNHQNNVPENLMVLCRPCHKDLHFREDPEIRVRMSISAMGNTNGFKKKVMQ